MNTAFANFDRLPKGLSADLSDSLDRIASVAQDLSYLISKGNISDEVQNQTAVNSDGDEQKPLDVYADEAYLEKMKNSSIRLYASEEQPTVLDLGGNGTLALAIDPLDGSSNIDTNVSIGSIFSIRSIPSQFIIDTENPPINKPKNFTSILISDLPSLSISTSTFLSNTFLIFIVQSKLY